MKFSVDVDCTPQEAREFLGWPDFSEAQQQIAEAMVQHMQNQMSQLGMDEAMKMMFGGAAAGAGGWQDAQKAFWSAFTDAAKGGKGKG